MFDFLKTKKCYVNLRELDRISLYFLQNDVYDDKKRAKAIDDIYKMIGKNISPKRAVYEMDMIGGGIDEMRIKFTGRKFDIEVESINTKGPHGIELLTLNQLGYVKRALKDVYFDLWREEDRARNEEEEDAL